MDEKHVINITKSDLKALEKVQNLLCRMSCDENLRNKIVLERTGEIIEINDVNTSAFTVSAILYGAKGKEIEYTVGG